MCFIDCSCARVLFCLISQYIYRYINHVNSNYIQIIYIIYINILYILCIVLCIEDYRCMTRMTYGFLPRPERPLMVPRHSPPLHRQRLRPCHLTKSNTKTWQKRYNVSTKLNSDIFLKHLETLWIILRCEEISVDKQKHVETVSCCHSCTMKVPLVAGGFRLQVFSGQSSAWVQHPCQTQSAGSPSLWAAGTSIHLCRCPSLKRDSN